MSWIKKNILPSLVQINKEYNVIPETSQSVGSGHGDDEGEDVINECVESLEKNVRSVKQSFGLIKFTVFGSLYK